jgi:hypothetical protein
MDIEGEEKERKRWKKGRVGEVVRIMILANFLSSLKSCL